MATSLFFHASTNSLANLPTDEQSSLAPDTVKGTVVTSNRLMNTTAGASPASIAITTTADTGAHNYYFGRWVSETLVSVTSITAQTWTYKFAAKESNTAANFPCSGTNKAVRVTAYVWRPGTGKVGDILDGVSNNTVDESTAGTETYHVVTFSGSLVSGVQNGDVIVFEVWFVITQGTAAAYTDTFYYDGTTESAENATVTTPASLISTPQTLTFGANVAQTYTHLYHVKNIVGQPSIFCDGSDDYIDCGNEGSLWSQALTKFSIAFWMYPTAYGSAGHIRDICRFDWGNPGSFDIYMHDVATQTILFGFLNDSSADGTCQDTNASLTNLNQWYHVACTWDGTLGSANTSIFVNGVLSTNHGTATGTVTGNDVLKLGGNGFTDSFQGNIKDFRWYTTKALTQTEVNNIIANNSSAPVPDYWLKMNEGTGNPYDSITGTKNGGLGSGAVWSQIASPIAWQGGSTFTHIFKIRQLATQSFTHIYNILTTVSAVAQTFTHKFNIRSLRTQSFTHKFNIRKLILQTFTHKFNIKNLILQTFTHKFNIKKLIAQTFTHKFNIKVLILQSYIHRYKLRQLILQSFIHKYNLKNLATQTFTHRYNLRQLATQTFTHKFNIKRLVAQTFIHLYNILGLGAVAAMFTHRYNLKQLTVQSYTHKFNLKNLILQSFTHRFNIRQLTLQSFTHRFNIRQLATQTYTHKFNLKNLIAQTFTHRFNILNLIAQTYIHLYNIKILILQSFTHRYNMRQLTLQTFTHKYNIRSLAIQSFTHLYNILGLGVVSKSFTHKYNMLQLTTQTYTHKYNLKNLIARTFTHLYNLHQLATQSFTHRYNLKNLITQTYTHIYNIRQLTTQTFTHRFNILETLAQVLQSFTHVYNLRQLATQSYTHKFNIIGRITQSFTHRYKIRSAFTLWQKLVQYFYTKYSGSDPTK